MKKLRLPTGKSRNPLTLALVLALAAVLLAASLLLPLAMHRYNIYVDMTPEGLYTMTETLEKELSGITQDVEIIFCTDSDYLFANDETRYPYITCKQLADANEHISVRHINVVTDPSSADPYRQSPATEISWDNIIVSSGGRYKIMTAAAFYTAEDGEKVAYNGEYRIATAILSLTSYKDGPAAYFTVGHGERYYMEGDEGSDPTLSAFYELLLDAGLRIGKIDLDTVDAVPEDCALLIMCGPTEDYANEDYGNYYALPALEKIDRYLANNHSFMVFRDALAPDMPALNEYLHEWGFAFDSTSVTSEKGSLASLGQQTSTGDRLIAVYPTADNAAIGHSMFSAIADMATPPKTVFPNACSLRMVWRDNLLTTALNVTRCVSSVFFAPSDAKAHDREGYLFSDNTKGNLWLAAVSSEAQLVGAEYEYSYVFGSGSTALISNEYLSDPAFGNGDVMYSVIRSLSRSDVYASTALGGFDMNTPETYGGKMYEELHLTKGEENVVHYSLVDSHTYKGLSNASFTGAIIVCGVLPCLTVIVTGIVVLRRRKVK